MQKKVESDLIVTRLMESNLCLIRKNVKFAKSKLMMELIYSLMVIVTVKNASKRVKKRSLKSQKNPRLSNRIITLVLRSQKSKKSHHR